MRRVIHETEEEWMEDRGRKITGSTLSDVASSSTATVDVIKKELTDKGIDFPKSGAGSLKSDLEKLLSFESRVRLMVDVPFKDEKKRFWELVANRVAIPDEDGISSNTERGHRLEPIAVQTAAEELGIAFVSNKNEIWYSDEDENIAISPDAYSRDVTACVEAKCLSSALHIEAWKLGSIPTEYELQVIQYFVVNEKLKTLYFVMYDPRVVKKPLLIFPFTRGELAEKIETYKEYQKLKLERIYNLVNELTT